MASAVPHAPAPKTATLVMAKTYGHVYKKREKNLHIK
jgi:hypothetical protein